MILGTGGRPHRGQRPSALRRLLARALSSYGGSTDQVVVGTKGGMTRRAIDGTLGGQEVEHEGEVCGFDGSLNHLRRAVEGSLRSLERDVIVSKPPRPVSRRTATLTRHRQECRKVELTQGSRAEVRPRAS